MGLAALGRGRGVPQERGDWLALALTIALVLVLEALNTALEHAVSLASPAFHRWHHSSDPAARDKNYAQTFSIIDFVFGTAYFPYSTLGENFEKWHMPGQEKTTYWTLSADTVTNYKLFTDDIKRDLRILKSTGFQSVRLHHLEMLDQLEALNL